MKKRLVNAWPVTWAAMFMAFSAFAAGPVREGGPVVPSVSSGVAKVRCLPKAPCSYTNGVGTVLEGLRWGMTHVDVVQAYNRAGGLFDQQYNGELAKMQPGRAMTAKEAERDDKKRALEANFVPLGATPTGYDATALRGEYTYRNREAIQAIADHGLHRFFFYFGNAPGDRLWKVYDEVRLEDGGPLGATFQDAVAAMSGALGASPRMVQPDAARGVTAPTAEWQDDKTHLRLVDRSGEHVVALVVEDKATLGALPQLRANKPVDPFAIDPSIQAVTNSAVTDPNDHQPPKGDPKKR